MLVNLIIVHVPRIMLTTARTSIVYRCSCTGWRFLQLQRVTCGKLLQHALNSNSKVVTLWIKGRLTHTKSEPRRLKGFCDKGCCDCLKNPCNSCLLLCKSQESSVGYVSLVSGSIHRFGFSNSLLSERRVSCKEGVPRLESTRFEDRLFQL